MSLFGSSGGTSGTTSQSTSSSTRYDPKYEQFAGNILDRATAAADQPSFRYPVQDMFAGFTGDQNRAFDQLRGYQGQYQPYYDTARSGLDRASQVDVLGSAQPYLTEAGQSTRPWEAGSGAINQSMRGWNDPATQASYMDPYAEGAITRAHDISTRNFLDKTMPGVTKQFAMGQGALGRGNYNRYVGNTLRDFGGELAGTSATMMDKAYWNAAGQFNADQNRLLSAGTAAGNLASQNMRSLSDLGTANYNITSGAINTGIGLANAYSNQAGALSNTNLQNTNALLLAGNQQQQQEQLPLTAQYQQEQEAWKHPYQMVNFLNASQRGVQFPTYQNTSMTGSTSGTSTGQPSTAGSVLGGAAALNSIFGRPATPGTQSQPGTPAQGGIERIGNWIGDQFSTPNPGYPAARGGRIPRYYRGGAVSRFADGGRVPMFGRGGALGRRHYDVGGVVPVQAGMFSRTPMPPPGGLPPIMGQPGGVFSGGGPGMPMPPMGALGTMG